MFSLKKELFVIYGRRRLPGKIGVIEYKTNNDNNGQNIFAVSVTQESHQYDEQYGHDWPRRKNEQLERTLSSRQRS